MARKVVICGAGFLGSNIARAVAASTFPSEARKTQILLASRHPQGLYGLLRETISEERLLPPVPLDVTKPSTLVPAFTEADVVVSIVGIMHGSPKDFEEIQLKGSENIARAARNAGAKLIHFSAIGASTRSSIPYWRTKALAEASIRQIDPNATIIRPSIVFGPGDSFFNRFSKMSKVLPLLPVFSGGQSRFQPVYVGDIARAVEVLSRNDPEIEKQVAGKYLEAGGPEIFTYRELMQLVLKYNRRSRPIVSFPYEVGMIQGAIMERLPLNLFTLTRAQVEQLKQDNIVNPSPSGDHVCFRDFSERYFGPLSSVHDILPTYL